MAQGLDDAAVVKQLNNMVSFIRKEAEEKAAEIIVLAEEEFTIEKAKLVQTQKLKLMKEYERKEKQVDVTKKMYAHSQLAIEHNVASKGPIGALCVAVLEIALPIVFSSVFVSGFGR
jgi:hypothetical protein